MFGDALSQINQNVLYIAVALLVVSAILAIIRRIITIAIVIVIIAVAMASLGPISTRVQENYNFSINRGIATIQVADNTIELTRDSVEEIKIEHKGLRGYRVNVRFKDGQATIDIPGFMKRRLVKYLAETNIPTEIIN